MNDDNETPPESLAADVLPVLVEQRQKFLAFLEKRTGNRALAEDILQDAFARSVGKLDQLRQDESVVAWFYRMLRNAAIDHSRRAGTRNRALEGFASHLESESQPDGEVQSAVCQCVLGVAKTLKPEYATVLDRVEVEGLAVKEFAEQEGISASNAGVRIFRAREALKKRVAASCGACAEHGCWNCTCK